MTLGRAMKVIDRGVVCRGVDDSDAQSCTFPAICVLPNGRWLCTFRAAPRKNTSTQKTMLTWSDDQGKTWSTPTAPWQAIDVDGRVGRCHSGYLSGLGGQELIAAIRWVDCSDPQLPFFNEQTEGLLDTRTILSRSLDAGETWSKLWVMDRSPFDVPVPLTGPILQLPDGELICQFELNKHYYDTTPWRHRSVMMFSNDGGKTWLQYAFAPSDRENRIFYWDQRPSVLPGGRILNVFWTYDTTRAQYLNIHASESIDCGRTWSELWDLGIPGQPAAPVPLPDGRIALVYVDRVATPTIKLRISHADARDWPQRTETVIHEGRAARREVTMAGMPDAWAEMGAFSVGLPATALLPNGDIVIVYYAGLDTDHTDIYWVRTAV